MDKIGQIPKGRRTRNLRIYVLMPLVELVRLPNGAEAELLRGRLESAGVHAVCFDAGMNIAESVGLMIPVRVMVLDEDMDEAKALMDEFTAY